MKLQQMSSERLFWKNEGATQERHYTHFFLKKGSPQLPLNGLLSWKAYLSALGRLP